MRCNLKVKFEIEIPKDDYATLSQWLKYYGKENTVQNTLEHGVKLDIARLLPRAREHMKTGKSAYERFKETVLKE